MNTAKLARSTLVLDRETHERLNYVAHRMGVSRSSLVREVLSEPVEMMERWLRAVPEDQPVTPEAVAQIGDVIQMDLVDFIDRATAPLEQLQHVHGPASGGDA